MYVDIFYGKCVSLMGNKYATFYCTPFHWMCVDPMKKKGEAHLTLDNLFRKVGVPRVMVPDNAKELTKACSRPEHRKHKWTIHPIEANTLNMSIAEDGVRELKRAYQEVHDKDQHTSRSLGSMS